MERRIDGRMLWAVLYIPLYAESTEFSEFFSLPIPSFCCEKVGYDQANPCSGNKEGEITLPLKLHAKTVPSQMVFGTRRSMKHLPGLDMTKFVLKRNRERERERESGGRRLEASE